MHPCFGVPSGVCVEPDSRAFYKLRHNLPQSHVQKTQLELVCSVALAVVAVHVPSAGSGPIKSTTYAICL